MSFLFFALIFSAANAETVKIVEIKKITTGGKYSKPQWSPDGTKIYASGDKGSWGNLEI
jgi:dipeptidyl aminopeptidase/acylaminoacyl peptidase